ncbi:MAG: HAMP domain-containing protein [Bacteroidetes bacterium]|nr:HAMP domain-containing protein [Bacteroidota bacterium]
MPIFVGQILLLLTIFSTVGLFVVLYYRNTKNISNRYFLATLVLVLAYLFSHGIHFLFIIEDDVTILDQSCHFFLMAIMLTLSFFSYYFNNENKMPSILKGVLIIPTFIIFIMLWTGNIIEESHKHGSEYAAHYNEFYKLYILWYAMLLLLNVYWLIKKYLRSEEISVKHQILYLLIGLILTNVISFTVGIIMPWILGFYYLVEISPLAFLVGIVLFTVVSVNRYNLFPTAINKLHSFSLNKKVLFAALVVIPIILVIQLPIGRAIITFHTSAEWIKFTLVSLMSGVVVSVSMAYIISKIIANPINLLRLKTEQVGQGNYGIKVGFSSNDEIGQLAQSFDEMSNTLYENQLALIESGSRIEALLNAFERSNALIAIIDEDDNVLESNSNFMKQFKINKKSKFKYDFFVEHEVSRELVSFEQLKQHLIHENIIEWEVLIQNEQNSIILISITRIQLPQSEASIYLLVGVDITEKKKLQKELAQSEKLVALGKMAAVLAHEIKTPLTSIKMNCDILFEELDDAGHQASFEIINKETNRLNNLIKEVLEFSREIKLLKSDFDLKKLIDEICTDHTNLFKENALSVINNVENYLITADREKLYRVFLNLITNAQEATDVGGELNIASHQEENNFIIMLSDNGPGVLPEIEDKLFEPFHTSKTSGTGLGLSISKRIIEAHSGTIELLNEASKGATFKLSLPKN